MIAKLGERRQSLALRLKRQKRLHFYLRVWLILHIPCSLVFVALLPWHVFDATEVKWAVQTAGPSDYASSESCAKCHPQQYDEWITSMHAIAQSSPVTDLQNRLVLYKEARDLQSGALPKPLVGNLCVKCHAPTGSLGSLSEQEDPLIEIKDRAPASQFGVSCVACHQIDKIHATPARDDPDRLEYKNIENLEWTQGRTMLGQLGEPGPGLPSVGNSEHKGEFRDHFGDSSFCASCHTVVVDDPITKQRIVKLQDTYTEWKDGGDKKQTGVNWFKEKVACMDCHGRDLSALASKAKTFAREHIPLEERRSSILAAVKNAQNLRLPPEERFAAKPERGFDLRLEPRRRFLHTFTGVDYHLEPDLPYPAGHPRSGENPKIQQKTLQQTQDLLSIAAALLIRRKNTSSIEVDVLNLATGHHMPAGFAFARETWLEVAVSDLNAVDDESAWQVLVGGRKGRPLRGTEELDKQERGLRNFQAVLFNQKHFEEVVLQNETDGVLAGNSFDDPRIRRKFPDREGFLVPGEIRRLSIDLRGHERDLQKAKRIRVRFLLRNLPPEFLDGLADKFENEHNDLERAQRTRNLKNGLRIHEITQDIF